MPDVLVSLVDNVVVSVENIEDAPAAAIELYRESLADPSMGVKFDCYWLHKPGHILAHVIVAGKEVGLLP